MKRISIFLIAILTHVAFIGNAQIAITSSDMPANGDTIRMSSTVVLDDPSPTGADYHWDFTSLMASGQNVEKYISSSSTPFLYQIVFNQNVANLASPIENLDFIPGFEVTEAYVYYKSTEQKYVRAGYAASIMGIPIPMKFDQAELLYTFPLQFGNPADSSHSNYTIAMPGIGYFNIERNRVNEVDGWGVLETPYGIHDVLRIKSTVYERDSLYLDSLQMGLPIVRNYIEYQWVGKEQGLPLLTITDESGVKTARYRDIIQNFDPLTIVATDETICQGDSITLSVKVSGGDPPYTYTWNNGQTTSAITVAPQETTAYSVMVVDSQFRIAYSEIEVTVIPFVRYELGTDTLLCSEATIAFDAGNDYQIVRWFVDDVLISQSNQFVLDSSGIGLGTVALRVEYETGMCIGSSDINVGFHICEGVAKNDVIQLLLYPNPAQEKIYVDTKAFARQISYTMGTTDGRIVKSDTHTDNEGRLEIEINSLKPGVYQLTITDQKQSGTALLIKH